MPFFLKKEREKPTQLHYFGLPDWKICANKSCEGGSEK